MIKKAEIMACPVATTVNLIGNKWKLLILRELIKGTRRYGELLRSVQPISQKVLTENLKSMELDSIIIRTAFPEVPPRVEYQLSQQGQEILPIIQAMESFGRKYQAFMLQSNASKNQL